MKKTIVISPYQKGVSGTLEQELDSGGIKVRIRLNHPPYSSEDILRLYALSTSHAARKPYLAEIFDGQSEELTARIMPDAIGAIGYGTDDIDTYVVTLYNREGETAIAGAFLGLEWCAARFLQTSELNHDKTKSHTHEQEPAHDAPMNNAKQLLGERRGSAVSDDRLDAIAGEFAGELKCFERITLPGDDGYIWYRIDKTSPVGTLSSVLHIIGGSRTAQAVRTHGYYIAGISKSNKRHIAIGVPSANGVCPVPQVSDCSVFRGGYHITGIFLANDGQYFEKYLQN